MPLRVCDMTGTQCTISSNERESYDTLLTGLATVSSFMVLYCRMGTAVVFSRSTTSVPLSSAICSVQQ